MDQKITKQFTRYVSQNIIGMLGVSCYIIVDTFFISLAAGTDGITVLNLALPVFSLIFAIGSMVGMGSATRYAILRAQKDSRADEYFGNAVLWACILGMMFMAVGALIPDKIIALMGGDEHIVALGVPYNRIFLFFAPFFMLNYVISSFVRNDNAPTRAMIGTMVGSLSNILFDYIFMFPLGMGLAGAALATAASPVISILICGTHFFRKENNLRFVWRRPSIRLILKSAQLGIAAFIGELSSGVTTAVFNFLILGLAGNVGVAAYGVVANYAIIATAIFNGISQGSQPLVSRYYGSGDRKGAGRLLRLGMGTALGFAILVCVTVYTFTGSLVELFNSEHSAEMSHYAFVGMRLYFPGFLFAGVNIIGSGFLSATARPKAAFLISILRGVAAIIVCSFVLSHFFGFTGVWLSFGAAELVTLVVTICALPGGNINRLATKRREAL